MAGCQPSEKFSLSSLLILIHVNLVNYAALLHVSYKSKRVMSLRGPSSRHCACEQPSSLQRNVAEVASRWQHCVPFDQSEI